MPILVICSGYFNPIHPGHIRHLKAAKALGDRLLVVVNNDRQQMQKKGKIIMTEAERVEVVGAIRYVDEVLVCLDDDNTVRQTLAYIAKVNIGSTIIFANGGDRTTPSIVPETPVCDSLGIEMRFDVGGTDKILSSSIINTRLGIEDVKDS